MINLTKQFSLDEVNNIIGVVYNITKKSKDEVDKLLILLDNSKNSTEIESKIDNVIEIWKSKIEKLGGNSKALWLVDFDSGKNCYCWKFPENTIKFCHEYSEGFASRKEI